MHYIKGIILQKNEHSIIYLASCCSSSEWITFILKNVGNQTVSSPHLHFLVYLFIFFVHTMTRNCLV